MKHSNKKGREIIAFNFDGVQLGSKLDSSVIGKTIHFDDSFELNNNHPRRRIHYGANITFLKEDDNHDNYNQSNLSRKSSLHVQKTHDVSIQLDELKSHRTSNDRACKYTRYSFQNYKESKGKCLRYPIKNKKTTQIESFGSLAEQMLLSAICNFDKTIKLNKIERIKTSRRTFDDHSIQCEIQSFESISEKINYSEIKPPIPIDSKRSSRRSKSGNVQSLRLQYEFQETAETIASLGFSNVSNMRKKSFHGNDIIEMTNILEDIQLRRDSRKSIESTQEGTKTQSHSSETSSSNEESSGEQKCKQGLKVEVKDIREEPQDGPYLMGKTMDDKRAIVTQLDVAECSDIVDSPISNLTPPTSGHSASPTSLANITETQGQRATAKYSSANSYKSIEKCTNDELQGRMKNVHQGKTYKSISAAESDGSSITSDVIHETGFLTRMNVPEAILIEPYEKETRQKTKHVSWSPEDEFERKGKIDEAQLDSDLTNDMKHQKKSHVPLDEKHQKKSHVPLDEKHQRKSHVSLDNIDKGQRCNLFEDSDDDTASYLEVRERIAPIMNDHIIVPIASDLQTYIETKIAMFCK